MASAMVALATTTLGSAASSVTFGSIPATYRDLRLVMIPKATALTDVRITLNGDTGSNYPWVVMGGSTTNTAFSASGTQPSLVVAYDNRATTDASTNYLLDIMDYSATDKHKSILVRNNNPSQQVESLSNRWASTSAVTTIYVYATSSTFAAGSTFALYGIASA